jgi:Homeodomain-like domain
MRSRAEVSFVLELVRAGWNDCEIARETGIPRQTILDWRNGRTPDFDRVRTRTFPNDWVCVVCRGRPLTLPQAPYTYLLWALPRRRLHCLPCSRRLQVADLLRQRLSRADQTV